MRNITGRHIQSADHICRDYTDRRRPPIPCPRQRSCIVPFHLKRRLQHKGTGHLSTSRSCNRRRSRSGNSRRVDRCRWLGVADRRGRVVSCRNRGCTCNFLPPGRCRVGRLPERALRVRLEQIKVRNNIS